MKIIIYFCTQLQQFNTIVHYGTKEEKGCHRRFE